MNSVAIFREKIILWNTEQTEILIHSVGIPSFFRNENARNSVLSDSAEDKKARNSVPHHFLEERNTNNFEILFRTIDRNV